MAFDTFMWITGGTPAVKGETKDDVYAKKNAFEIYSFSWGASNPVSVGSKAGGSGAGKVSISSFSIMKKTDTASPNLFQNCAQGTHFPSANVDMRKAGGTTPVVYLQYEFNEVFVESIQWSGSSGGDDTPTESVSFAFGSVTIKYTPQVAAGSTATPIPASWNIVNNKKDATIT